MGTHIEWVSAHHADPSDYVANVVDDETDPDDAPNIGHIGIGLDGVVLHGPRAQVITTLRAALAVAERAEEYAGPDTTPVCEDCQVSERDGAANVHPRDVAHGDLLCDDCAAEYGISADSDAAAEEEVRAS